MKVLALESINGFIVTNKIDAAASDLGFQANEGNARLVKLVLRDSRKPKVPVGIPVFCFVKNFTGDEGPLVAVYEIVSGHLQFVDSSFIAAETEVKGEFKISGVTYKVKDAINGCKRYRPFVPKRRPRDKKVRA